MEKDRRSILGVANTRSSEEMDALLDAAAYQAAVDLDAAYSEGSMTEADLRAKILIHREKLLHYLVSFYLRVARGKKEEGCPMNIDGEQSPLREPSKLNA
jgi:hypothetical protein